MTITVNVRVPSVAPDDIEYASAVIHHANSMLSCEADDNGSVDREVIISVLADVYTIGYNKAAKNKFPKLATAAAAVGVLMGVCFCGMIYFGLRAWGKL